MTERCPLTVEYPKLARLSPETRQALARLIKRANVQMDLLDGQTPDDLKAVLALPGSYLVKRVTCFAHDTPTVPQLMQSSIEQ